MHIRVFISLPPKRCLACEEDNFGNYFYFFLLLVRDD